MLRTRRTGNGRVLFTLSGRIETTEDIEQLQQLLAVEPSGQELILDLKNSFTIVIVTHNMQQAARISDFTGFFYLGELVEFDRTAKMFTNPSRKQTEDYVTGRFG